MANGLGTGPSEAETFWTEFLRSLKARGLDGVKLVISDAHSGLKAAIQRVFDATWQRCRVGLLKNSYEAPSRTIRQPNAAGPGVGRRRGSCNRGWAFSR